MPLENFHLHYFVNSLFADLNIVLSYWTIMIQLILKNGKQFNGFPHIAVNSTIYAL